MPRATNVLGTELQSCSFDPMTGFFRDGCCRSGADDIGLHLVCARDQWCLCVLRWKEAFQAGVAPQVVLEATHISTLEFVDLEDLEAHRFEE